jgi:hypothetical protein
VDEEEEERVMWWDTPLVLPARNAAVTPATADKFSIWSGMLKHAWGEGSTGGGECV